MYFTIESDREVYVDGIGLLKANEPMVVTEASSVLFEKLNHQKLQTANFPSYVKIVANVGQPMPEGDE
jgi:hypothetical protein